MACRNAGMTMENMARKDILRYMCGATSQYAVTEGAVEHENRDCAQPG